MGEAVLVAGNVPSARLGRSLPGEVLVLGARSMDVKRSLVVVAPEQVQSVHSREAKEPTDEEVTDHQSEHAERAA